MAESVKLFGRRPHEGRAIRTVAGVRKAARDETARDSNRVAPRAMGICVPRAMSRRSGLRTRRVDRPGREASVFAFERIQVSRTMEVAATLSPKIRSVSELL